jgi:hypothetical protein
LDAAHSKSCFVRLSMMCKSEDRRRVQQKYPQRVPDPYFLLTSSLTVAVLPPKSS